MARTSVPAKILLRVLDAMREIGILILAFTPLDTIFGESVPGYVVVMLMAIGFGLFVGALVIERRVFRV